MKNILVISGIIIIVFAILFLLIDIALGKSVAWDTGIIVDKVYIPSVSSTGVGYVTNTGKNNDGGVVYTNSKTKEKREIVVKGKKKIYQVPVDANQYYSVDIGKEVTVYKYFSKYLGMDVETKIR